MRDEYAQFRKRGAEILALAPHDLATTRALAEELAVPFPILADESRAAFHAYGVGSRWWSLGQRPGLFVIDAAGLIRQAHVGAQQWDIPPNAEILTQLDLLAKEGSE